jgi:hypothetical protein
MGLRASTSTLAVAAQPQKSQSQYNTRVAPVSSLMKRRSRKRKDLNLKAKTWETPQSQHKATSRDNERTF